MQNKDSWFHPLETFVQIEGKEIKVFFSPKRKGWEIGNSLFLSSGNIFPN